MELNYQYSKLGNETKIDEKGFCAVYPKIYTVICVCFTKCKVSIWGSKAVLYGELNQLTKKILNFIKHWEMLGFTVLLLFELI